MSGLLPPPPSGASQSNLSAFAGISTVIIRLTPLPDGSLRVVYTETYEVETVNRPGVQVAMRRVPRFVTLTPADLARIEPLHVGGRPPFHDREGNRVWAVPNPVK
jgi:hypothetical protein